MILRKINASLSLVTTVLFLNHAISLSIWMLYRCGIQKSVINMPKALMVVTALHAVLSILLAILGHKGAEKRKCNAFSAKNTSFNYASCILCSVIFAHCSFCKQGNNYLRNRKRLLGKTRFYPARRHQLSQHYTSGTCKN